LKHRDKKKDTDKKDRITIKPGVDPVHKRDQPVNTSMNPDL
jgi:hypothetical protein